MPRRVVAHRKGESFDLVEVPAPNEHHLQEVVKTHPQLIPADDLGLDGDLLVVGRETTLASGAIDLLCLARSGDLVLLEFKTGPQNPDFRHALAQVVDYGSDLWRLSVDEFERGVVERHLSKHPVGVPPALDLDSAVTRAWDLTEDERVTLRGRLAEVLATGDFIFVVAAQRFTAAMVRSLEYLNTTMRYGRFYLVEVVHLAGRDLTAHAAQVVASPPTRTATSASGAPTQANEADFLANLPSGQHREVMHDIFARCRTLGLAVHWGSKGASIRLPTADLAEPLSIGWAFPEGHQWQGARHLTLGVDPESLKQRPSVDVLVGGFVNAISTIGGAIPVNSKLHAYTFTPDVSPSAKEKVLEALEQLVKAVNGT